MTTTRPERCLVTGASGYIGGRLVPELLAAGSTVRVMARHPESLRDRPWAGQVEMAKADASDRSPSSRRCETSTSPTT